MFLRILRRDSNPQFYLVIDCELNHLNMPHLSVDERAHVW